MDLSTRFETLKAADLSRRTANDNVIKVRRNELDAVMPGFFPSAWPKAVTANIVDTAARDMGEILGELPTVRCRPRNSTPHAASVSERRTKVALGYLEQSGLQRHFFGACDRLVSFGTLPLIVEPDFDVNGPVVRVADSRRTVYTKNLRGEVTELFEWWYERKSSLEAKFPHVNLNDTGYPRPGDDPLLEVVRYHGADGWVLFVPSKGATLQAAPHPFGKVMARVVELPKWDDEVHGTYEQAIYVQLARARMALYTMEAVDESLHAPIAVPNDVNKIPVGPDALIRTAQPEKVRRVALEVPREAWAEGQALEREERIAARYPEGRSGNIDASVITGQGVQALLGTIDSQVKTLQTLIGFELRGALSLAFEMDEILFGSQEKVVYGDLNGKKFEEKYRPSRDIAGDYSVDVTYGFMAGLDPNRATVVMLQLLGGGLLDRGTVQENLPFQLDVDDIRERQDREAVEDALRAGVQSMLSNIGTLAASGQDPTELLVKAATLISEREKGKPFSEALLEVFKQPEQPEQQDPFTAAAGDAGAPAPGAPPGEAPVQSPQQPGSGRLMQMLASLSTGGGASMSTRIAQQTPAA